MAATCIAFDLDFTLLNYHSENFFLLQYESMAQCLITLGLSEEFLSPEFTRDGHLKVQNGLIADLKTGFLLKLSASKHIIRAYLGFQRVSAAQLLASYSEGVYPLEKEEVYYIENDRYLFISHFALGGTHAFRVGVELIQRGLVSLSYADFGALLRQAVLMNYDTAYGKASRSEFYSEFFADYSKYLLPIPESVKLAFSQLRTPSTKVFLVTNSLQHYVEFSLEKSWGSDWKSHFDGIVYASSKPYFFLENSPFTPAGAPNEMLSGSSDEFKILFPAENYLYVGDHYIGDIWAAKQKDWTVYAVVPELFTEKQLPEAVTLESVEAVPSQVGADWGSLFYDVEKTYWWDFVTVHSDYISGSIGGALQLLSPVSIS